MVRTQHPLVRATLVALTLLAGCSESEQPAYPVDELADVLGAQSASGFVSLGEFAGIFDAETGGFVLEASPSPSTLGFGSDRTARQAYGFCNDLLGDGSMVISTDPESVSYSVADCIPEVELSVWGDLFYYPAGTFCVSVTVENRTGMPVANVIAEITEITPGYEGFRYLPGREPPCCGTGADLRGLEGQNLPTDLNGGAFRHAGVLADGASASRRWVLANAGGSFRFSGRIAAQLAEVENGLDDDCDGLIDNGLGSYPPGERCRRDADCEHRVCEDIDDTGLGVCAEPCEPGSFNRECEPCPFDCGESGTCDDGLLGTGECVCLEGWEGDACERCIPGRWGSECAGVCEPCGEYGACSEGPLGNGRCLCAPGGYGRECVFSCDNGVQDGDEYGVDCGGPTCAACPPAIPPCNGRGTPGAATGPRLVTHGLGDWCDPLDESVCLQRGATGLLYNEAAGETAYHRETSPLDTAWTPGSCEIALAGSPAWGTFRATVTTLLRSAEGLELCMVATETGRAFDIEFVSWSRSSSEASGFSYLRTGDVCACEDSFHGADCEFTCSDGIRNGSEDAVDCGGACTPCEDTDALRCNFRGAYSETEVAVEYVADAPCYRVSDAVCLARTTGGPPFNVESGHTGGRDPLALEGTLWAMGVCGEVVPWSQNPFHARSNASGWMLGEWCMLDRSTGVEHTITITEWLAGSRGGWSFTHVVQACECEPGDHGVSCQHSCEDGERNGDEIAVDCGGPCESCAPDWECNFNGVEGGVVEFEWDGSTCDPISEGVCLARDSARGPYNVLSETVWTAESPAGTRWAFGPCVDGDGIPTQDWRSAVWADGDGPRWSIGEVYCMLDETTGSRHDVTITGWESGGRGGGFSYRRAKECACARGFHGTHCSESCTDGIRNGDEALVDCGGTSCEPCPENWECNLRGVPSEETTLVRLDGAECDRISSGTCLDRSRSRGGPVYNEASGASGGHDHRGLAGTAWEQGVCDETPPRDADPFNHMVNSSGWMLGAWCMLDRSTGVEHEIEFAAWGRSHTGTTTYLRTSPTCACEAGAHGLNCEFTCSDGVQNGDEALVDCGGANCEPCLEDWQCSYNGTFEIDFSRITHEGNDPCYRISDGVCLGRSRAGGPPFNAAAGRLGTNRDSRALEGTLWALGECDLVEPTDDNPFEASGNRSGWQLQRWCMLDLSTGIEHTIDISSWANGRRGDWSFVHIGGACACDPHFHGSSCEYTCFDGVLNGEEDAVDCGGPCAPCDDGWQCHYQGTYSETTTSVTHAGDDLCFPISDGLCLGRATGGPPFNAAAGHIGGHIHNGLEGSFWAMGRCGEVEPLRENPFVHRRNSTGAQLGEWCVLDRTTGLEHSIEIESWASGLDGGWSYTHTGGQCECDPDSGSHGGSCQFSCSDGVLNGEESDVDCGGPCGPCAAGWQCSYRGEFVGTEVHYEHAGGGACDRVSDGVCISRADRQGLFNSEEETSYEGSSPASTRWAGALPCGSEAAPSQSWRDAVRSDGTGPRAIEGKSLCMLDQTTGLEWTVLFESWARGRTGGGFSYTRSNFACECGPGFGGPSCEEIVDAP